MGDFPRAAFDRFCSRLTIDSKEIGRTKLDLLGSQRYALDEIERAYNQGIRFFVICKGRQLGITTLSTALDLFWMMRHPGMTGAMVSDDETNRDYFRSLIEQYLKALPRDYRVTPRLHNRNQLVFRNYSRVQYMVAGTRKKATLGQGKGLNFCHGTEVSSWGDPQGFHSLMASLAESHPSRLYIFESTAKGLNHYYDLWQTANRARFMAPIFIGWWRKESYSFAKGSQEYRVYWDGKPTTEERDWMEDIQRLYHTKITPEQLAWWRYQLAEKFQGDLTSLMQEHPPVAELAFQLSGEQFFPAPAVVSVMKQAEALEPQEFRYDVGMEFSDLQLREVPDGELRVWEMPVEGATYVLGADPAYGSSEWKDCFAIEVLRCYSDRIEQVAEYLTPDCSMTAFAWIISHLAGAYRYATVIMEVNGPGRGVLDEVQKLPWKLSQVEGNANGQFADVIASMRHYFYKRPDSLSGNYLLDWSTNANTKMQAMNGLKDALLMGKLKVRSVEFAEQAKTVIQSGSYIGAEGRGKDDAIIAMSLAVECWRSQVQTEMLESNQTYESQHREAGKETKLNWMVKDFMDKLTHQTEEAA